jgi:phage gp29-like protein
VLQLLVALVAVAAFVAGAALARRRRGSADADRDRRPATGAPPIAATAPAPRRWFRRTERGIAGRLWDVVRGVVVSGAVDVGNVAPAAARPRGALSLVRPRPLDESPAPGQQARELKYSYYQDHPGHGCTPQRVVAIYRDAECGFVTTQCDLFDDLVENDCTLRNLLDQRNQAVAGKQHGIQAGGPSAEDELVARVLAAAFESLQLIAFFEHQLGFNKYGWGATEVDWGEFEFEGRTWMVPVWLANVPARRFRIDTRTDQLLLITDEKTEGEPLKPGRWCVTRGRGPLARAALMRSASWPALWKRFSTRDWVVYSEMFGIPLVQATYDDIDAPGGGATDVDSRGVAEDIVRKFGSSGGAVTPKSIEVKIHEAARTADSGGTHGGMIQFANAEMSKLINGSTLANDNAGSGGASYALGAVHDSVRWDNVVSDFRRLAEAVRTQIFVPFLRFNGLAGKVKAPHLAIQIAQDLSPKVRLECADIALNKLGIPISISQIRQDASFREPLNAADSASGAPKPEPADAAQAPERKAA